VAPKSSELLAQNKALLARIAELEAKYGKPPKTPDNSSLPPSRGQKGNVAEPTRVKKARKGHLGAARALAENPDATRDIYAERCACGAALEEAGQDLARAWDHVDLPPIKPITTRINLFRATCPCCKARVTAQAPADMPGGLAVRTRHKGCGRLFARLPDGRLQASDRAVRRPVRPDNLPGPPTCWHV
jgi:transposase